MAVCCPTTKLPDGSATYEASGAFDCVYKVGSGKRSVLFIPDIFGFHAHTVRFADDLARLGSYTVYFFDFFAGKPWDASKPLGPAGGEEWKQFYASMTSPEMYTKVKAAAAFVAAMDGGKKPLCIGFCWGAKMGSHLNAEGLVACTAMPHPSFVSVEDAEKVTAPIGLYPSKDDTAMLDVKAKLEERKLLGNYIFAEECVHGFAAARFDKNLPKDAERRDEVLAATVELFKKCE